MVKKPKLYLSQAMYDIAKSNNLIHDEKIFTEYGWQEVVITEQFPNYRKSVIKNYSKS